MTPRCVIVVAVLTLLGGCNGVLHGRPTFDTDLLVLTNPPAAGIPPTCQTLLNQNPADQETDVARNNCVFPLMTMIDQAYYRYQTSLFGSVNTGNAATDILSLGLTSAATLAGGNAAKSILAAIATGVNGAKGKIDADILYNRSIELIITQMDADRADWKARILSQIKHDRNYNIYAAAPDLLSYYQAGTWAHAVMALQAKTGTLLTSCQQSVKNQQLSNNGAQTLGCQPQSADAGSADVVGGGLPAGPGGTPDMAITPPAPAVLPGNPAVGQGGGAPSVFAQDAGAIALRNSIHDPDLSSAQRTMNFQAIESALLHAGYGEAAVEQWIDDPALAAQHEQVAKSLHLL
jgi:hypothetical protein